jgi:hypothetical protein
MTEIPTDEGNLYLSTAIDLFSRGCSATPPVAPHAELAAQTIKRGGAAGVAEVVFPTLTAARPIPLTTSPDCAPAENHTINCFDIISKHEHRRRK